MATPALPESLHGNGVTAARWAAILGGLGHTVTVLTDYDGGEYDVLIALHARKSAPAITAFRAARPNAPVVIALTGTDLYPSLAATGVDLDLLEQAAALLVLQRLGAEAVPARLRDRVRVIVQSVPPIPPEPPLPDCFEVVLLAHLRPVKDPLRLAEAVRLLPADSRVAVTHVGNAIDKDLAEAARRAGSERYIWFGGCPRPQALRLLARARLLAVTSLHEGGANVVSEALAAGVPVISARIPGSVGLLGEDYPGYYPPGDTAGLARLLDELEHDRGGRYTRLRECCAGLREITEPAREQQSWADLLAGLAIPAVAAPRSGSRKMDPDDTTPQSCTQERKTTR